MPQLVRDEPCSNIIMLGCYNSASTLISRTRINNVADSLSTTLFHVCVCKFCGKHVPDDPAGSYFRSPRQHL